MPRTPRQNEAIRDRRRAAILAAALRVYVEHGYHGAEVADVARRAGHAAGLVHYYFGSKRELFRTLFKNLLDQARQHNEALFALPMPAPEWVDRLVAAYTEAVLIAPDHVRFFHRIEHDVAAVGDGEVMAAWAATGAGLQHLMSARLQEAMARGQIPAGNPELLAALLWRVIDGAQRYLLDESGDPSAMQALAGEIQWRCRALIQASDTGFERRST